MENNTNIELKKMPKTLSEIIDAVLERFADSNLHSVDARSAIAEAIQKDYYNENDQVYDFDLESDVFCDCACEDCREADELDFFEDYPEGDLDDDDFLNDTSEQNKEE